MGDNIDILKIPRSNESEQRVLGALLLDNDSIDRVGDLSEDAFFSQAHRLIYRAIKKHTGPWDLISVAQMLESHRELEDAGGMGYIGSIVQSVPGSANIQYHAKVIQEHYTRRRIMVAANELSEIVANKGDIEEAMNKAQSALMSITDGVRQDEPKAISSVILEHLNVIEQRLGEGHRGIETGLIDLDQILNGGWHRGQVVVLAARPGMGKTALSMHHAIHAARKGYGVLYASMEMVASELADRALSSLGRIYLGNILSGKMTDEDWSGITAATGILHEIPFHILDKPGLNFYQLATFARRHKRKSGLDLLVIDYLQLMAGDQEEKRHSQIEEITRNLKTLAKELNIAVLLLSQLSRKTEDVRRPKLSHLRDSGSIEQDADVVLFIHREEVDVPETTWKNYADIHVAKNRQGALGRIGVTYIGHQVRFENFAGALPDWEAKTNKQKGFP